MSARPWPGSLTRASCAGFEPTFRVVAYASAPAVFFWIPVLGVLAVAAFANLATIWLLYVVAFFVFLVCGLLIGRLSATARVRLRQVEAERRDLAALTDLSQGFLADTNRESLLGLAVDRLRKALQCREVSIWLAQDPGELSETAATPGTAVRRNLIDLAYRQGNSAAYPSELGGTDIYLPIPVGVARAGVLVARGLLSSERMAEGCALLLGLSLERERFMRLAREAGGWTPAQEDRLRAFRADPEVKAALPVIDMSLMLLSSRGLLARNWPP